MSLLPTFNDIEKDVIISKEKFDTLFPNSDSENSKSSDFILNITIKCKNKNEYEVIRTIGPYVKGNSTLAKLDVISTEINPNEVDLSIKAKYQGIRVAYWAMFIITFLFILNAVWRISTLNNIDKYNLLIPPIVTTLLGLLVSKLYSSYRLSLMRSFEKYIKE